MFDATEHFDVSSHVIPCQNIRDYPNAVKDGTSILQLAVKEYRPHSSSNASSNDEGVTVIATHANGFPKVIKIPSYFIRKLCTFG